MEPNHGLLASKLSDATLGSYLVRYSNIEWTAGGAVRHLQANEDKRKPFASQPA